MSKAFVYLKLLVTLGIVSLLGANGHHIFDFLEHAPEGHLLIVFFEVALICTLSFIIFYLANETILPSFVVAILFGIAAKGLFSTILGSSLALGALVGIGATLILFSGGLETPWANFKRLVWEILALSFPGLFLTAILFSLSLVFIGNLLGVAIPIAVAVLLGAVLASTDPAAIIPVLRQLRFKQRDTKDIVISESAMTDVTGTLLTVALLSLVAGGVVFATVVDGYRALFTFATGELLAKQIFYGVLFGAVGYGLLELLTRFKRQHEREFEVDAAYLFFVPICIFTLALAFGGSGYLAAFVAGLLFVLTEHLHDTERFFNHTIEAFLKPTIFLLLGALVDLGNLLAYAGIGLVAAFVFMFVIRPLVVFVTLGPLSLLRRQGLGWRDLLFVAFVRETGAIPAVLLVTIVSSGVSGLEGLVPIGMWVILATLVIEPPLTPLVAKILGVAVPFRDSEAPAITDEASFVVLGSRGRSYIDRLDFVVGWANRHSIKHIVLLHCLEQKYTPELAAEIGREAEQEFDRINEARDEANKRAMKFVYVSRQGFLQKNIDDLARKSSNLVAIFVGRKVLDYRLHEIKKLPAPIYFID